MRTKVVWANRDLDWMSNSAKMRAGEAAVQFVKPGMRLGIGTGSTAEAFVLALSKAVDNGLDIVGVPTSVRTHTLCEKVGIPLTDLANTPELDLTIDGADEIDPQLNLIKGGGGALLREKIVAFASAEMIVIADDGKLVDVLGKYPLPIEVNAFGLETTEIAIRNLVDRLSLRANYQRRKDDNGSLFVTDGGHHIVDASFGRIPDANALADHLNRIPGVVEHGLFTGIASRAIVASNSGVEIIELNT